MHHPIDRIIHNTAFVIPVVEYWLEREIAPKLTSSIILIFDGLSKLHQTSFIEMRTYFSFGLILWDIPNSLTPQSTLSLLPIPIGLLILPCTHQCRQSLLLPAPFSFLSWTEKLVKAGTYARDRRALQQLALNVHVKHSDLT